MEREATLADIKRKIKPHMDYFSRLPISDKEMLIQMLDDDDKVDTGKSPKSNINDIIRNFSKI